MIRREKWSTPPAAQHEKGQRWGTDQGSHEIQKPASVGTVVRSTSQMWFGRDDRMRRPLRTVAAGATRRGRRFSIRRTVVRPRWRPARESTAAIRAVPITGHSTFSRRTRCATRSGNLFTGPGGPDERRWSVVVEPGHPVGDRGLRHEEPAGCLSCRPAASRAEFKNREAFDRGVVWAVTRRDALHASVLDAQLLAEQGQFALQVDGGGDAIGGREQGDPGQGEGVDDRGATLPGPAGGQSEPGAAVPGHDRILLGASILNHAAESDKSL